MSGIKIIECPRDAMQGIHEFIPTNIKVDYIQDLLKVGFDTLDMGSFVSENVIPQMKDTAEVIRNLDLSNTKTKLIVIIANEKGAELAHEFEEIDYLGFPFSISEIFQQRNTNSTIKGALKRVDNIQNICQKSGKELVIYISMAFGNPYKEDWSIDIAEHWIDVMAAKGIKIISLADTIGTSTPESIEYLVSHLTTTYPKIEIGAHIHTRPDDWKTKVASAFNSGCRRFDGALKGFGGCPMADDNLVGNMPTENLNFFFKDAGIHLDLDERAFSNAMSKAIQVFPL